MRVVSLCTLASLSRARALARSLERHEPDWPLHIVLIGRDDRVAATVADEEVIRLQSAAEELDLDVERLIARHSERELTVLLLPRLLKLCAEKLHVQALHLPPTVWVLGGLDPISAALRSAEVVLVPRLKGDLPEDGLEPTQAQLERRGRMADTIMAINPGAGASAFLSWWAAHVEDTLGSADGRAAGARPEDRPWLGRYLELAPARFGAAVLEDPGCSLSMWNLHARELASGKGGVLIDGRWPARFIDLPEFEPDRPHRLSPLASRVRISRSSELRELCTAYAGELQQAGWRDADHRRDVGRLLSDGLVYDEPMRSLYARARALGEDFGDLFGERGARAFIAWLEGLAPEGAGRGITRYVFYRVAQERPDVMRAYPLLDGSDGAEYVRWCWAFGRDELSIPERFMPPHPDHRGPRPRERHSSTDRPARVERHDGDAHMIERQSSRGRDAHGATAAAHSGDAAGGLDEKELAVRVTGYLRHALGLGAAARGYVDALGAAGVSVSTASVPLHHLELQVTLADEYGRHGFEELVHEGGHGFELIAVNADELPGVVERLGDDYFRGPRIGIWGWETNSIPARWQRAFSLIDEIWVYSQFMAKNFEAVAPVPVLSLPPPVHRAAMPPEGHRLGVPDGFLFLFIFDYLSTIQRKNPIGLIDAFKRAFRPGEGPQLLIKTLNAPLRPLAEEEVLWAAHGRADIHVVDCSLSGEELLALMAGCDCYASLHRAEGFGLTMAEAMALGKPVIATNYSGNVDFMTADNSYLVEYSMRRVGPDCEIYPPEGEWAEPSVEHASEIMRRVFSDRRDTAKKGARARADIARLLSPKVTGRKMRERLQYLSARAHPQREHLVS
jgi:glycosyltransferase involved in cell wall biosynthesis